MSSRRSFSPMLRLFFLLLFALVSASPTVVAVRPASAQATLVVTRATDTDDGVCDSDCSLREAIADATAGATITFAAGVDTVTLTSDELRISTSLTIDGGSGVTIERDSGAGNFRIFTISGAGVEVTLDSLTIRNGRVTGDGGGIFNSDATLTISNSTVSGNRTDDGASGGTSGRAGGDGGGIFNTGNLTISNSTVGSNRAGNGGSGSIFDGNGGDGGGIYNRGIVTISNGITIMDATVMVQDNDGANVLINPTSLSVSARGITDSYTVVLTSRPTADVTIVIVPDAQLRANGPILTFTPATWDTPQVVTVAALDATAAAGTRGGTVSHVAVSSDSDYNGIDIMDVTVTVQGDVEGGELGDTTIVYLPLIVR